MISSKLVKVLKGIRPWSLPMTIFDYIAVVLVTYIIYLKINLTLIVLGIIGSIFLHIASNIFNDYFDFKKNIDKEGNVRPYHLIIDKILSPNITLIFGFISSAIAIFIGLFLTFNGRPLSIILGLLGFLLAYGYSGFPFYLKYNALGEITAYLAWGIVVPLGAYYLATDKISFVPLIVGLPTSVYLFTVMNINNIRDINYDKNSGAKTIAIILGKYKAKMLFFFELFMPYLFVMMGIFVFKVLPITTLLSNITILYNYVIIRNAINDNLTKLDVNTAMQALLFGVMYTFSIGLTKFL
ncbi:prenyltransferase [Caldisphaera lagunensis]|nr:prenyltransferase [Caldisphaera lagunensis]